MLCVAPTGLRVNLRLYHRAYALGYTCFAPSGLRVSSSRFSVIFQLTWYSEWHGERGGWAEEVVGRGRVWARGVGGAMVCITFALFRSFVLHLSQLYLRAILLPHVGCLHDNSPESLTLYCGPLYGLTRSTKSYGRASSRSRRYFCIA